VARGLLLQRYGQAVISQSAMSLAPRSNLSGKNLVSVRPSGRQWQLAPDFLEFKSVKHPNDDIQNLHYKAKRRVYVSFTLVLPFIKKWGILKCRCKRIVLYGSVVTHSLGWLTDLIRKILAPAVIGAMRGEQIKFEVLLNSDGAIERVHTTWNIAD